MKMKTKTIKRLGATLTSLCLAALMTACQSKQEVIIYTNADDEAIEAMQDALDSEGYAGKYVFQSFSTSELGGKLIAEGTNIEADLVTMSSYYIDGAQKANSMFKPLNFNRKALFPCPDYMAPVTAQEGTVIYNTKMLGDEGLPVPASLRDLSLPAFKGHISITDVNSSSTAWLLILALVDRYGEAEAGEILQRIVDNAGPHFEKSGSAPLKKVRAGEVSVGFGLRQQAVLDKKKGLPIDYKDPAEGNFILLEAVAQIDHGAKNKPEAARIAEIIATKARPAILKHYPVLLYEGEQLPDEKLSPGRTIKQLSEPLTLPLLKRHSRLMTGE